MFGRFLARKPEPRVLRLSVNIFIEKDDKGFHGFSPALKGLHVCGTTVEETLKNASEAIDVYLDSLSKHGDPLPIGPHFSVEETPPMAQRESVTIEWPSMMQMSGVS